jgi:cytidine deaminase
MTTRRPGARARSNSKPSASEAGGDELAEESRLVPKDHPELVFGLIGPVGVNLDPVISILSRNLKTLNYRAKTIRLSHQIEKFLGSNHGGEPEDERIINLMDEGTRIRVTSERGDAVALLGIAEIWRVRNEELNGSFEGNAYILRSLKHPHEIETLRNVYGKGFFVISAYSPREVRVSALAEKISRSQFERDNNARAKAENIIERDESEDNIKLGQDVKDAFPLADLFVDSRSKASLENQIGRFLELLFGNVYLTPARDEHGMYLARSAALRSADLGRQVGAAILRPEGDLIAVGCNDVPKAGGDLYWPGDKGDARDFQQGIDATADEKTQVLGELLKRLHGNELLSPNIAESDLKALVNGLISGEKLKDTRIMSLLEFGRSVHAEMAALMTAARLGVSVQGATLFSTTFPCHMCARHIVASGIKRVIYIEPYPKSKAKQLHQDSISVDPVTESPEHVNFEPFVGISPKQYQSIFNARESRKDSDGRIIDWRAKYGKPRFARFLNTYHDIETMIVTDEIPILAKRLGINVD